MEKKKLLLGTLILLSMNISTLQAQSFGWICSTENNVWQESKIKLQSDKANNAILSVEGNEEVVTFKHWGTCFNELGWDALNMLSLEQQDSVLFNLFSPKGDLKITVGRIPMNANDYARDWYSCDEVPGDFSLKYFNINRDKTTLIPYIHRAQKYNPEMAFWISPWGPPSWMKINQYYSVTDNGRRDNFDPRSLIALDGGVDKKDKRYYPKQVTENDYFIQDPRYLQTYANYFCKFVNAYNKDGIKISRVMFQNEPWAYSKYPACAWTPEGIINFNVNYLAPTIKKQLPEVELYLGTLNTNRLDIIDKILSDSRIQNCKEIKGIGFQWWGGQTLPTIRKKFPKYRYIQTESECGSGTFDWKAAEHTFNLINHYLGNGCEEYTFWNAILCDEGKSSWGWKQNALIRVDSQKGTYTYTPEYYAVKHFCNKVVEGTKVLAYNEKGEDKLSAMVLMTKEGKYIVIAGNYNDEAKPFQIQLGNKQLKVELPAHSFNTFYAK
ncbi:glycoside hydrolase family 30 beta sandwich domain-containing protein [uncultured Bacteroides sp.]|uniref:glycoside hydrolase family 30 protein n=1 Tax=uncultured Bacteroides sp. TaxID=162156 RepID=UPI0026117A7A|nr:glycoside hydrolase family 30 beta sandwich domain-containing protein [uncultured Bacteroides sp.]